MDRDSVSYEIWADLSIYSGYSSGWLMRPMWSVDLSISSSNKKSIPSDGCSDDGSDPGNEKMPQKYRASLTNRAVSRRHRSHYSSWHPDCRSWVSHQSHQSSHRADHDQSLRMRSHPILQQGSVYIRRYILCPCTCVMVGMSDTSDRWDHRLLYVLVPLLSYSHKDIPVRLEIR